MSTRHKFIVGKRYMIRFLDHALSNDQVIVTCRVYGWITKVEKKFISISTWEVEDEEYRNDNIEVVNIIRSTIVESKRIP